MVTAETGTPIDQLKLVGGDAALDFANTVPWDGNVPYNERLKSYERLLAWSSHAGIIGPAERDALAAEAGRRPAAAELVVMAAVELREVIHHVFAALARGQEPAQGDLARLNAAIARALPHARLVRAKADEEAPFAWSWEPGVQLDRPLWPVIRAATELLTSPRLARVHECDGERCGWLFVDTSKGGRRRWCSMDDCGNRAKAKRHYARHKDEQSG
ncbi:MAG TPA: ABATE domain-containing protein [Thermomicrobiaceae bacterium]|nr:ABATE domain-containing protein [Thermomicrobiaceae bacterium]